MGITVVFSGKKIIGVRGEKIGAFFLEKRGYSIIHKNFFTKFGEIDLIAKKAKMLAFVEVKTRIANNKKLSEKPEAAISKGKYFKIRKSVEIFIFKNPKYIDFDLKIHAISIFLNQKTARVRFLKNVFY
ncbi:MAG: hypothetical protein GF347_02820 [Candidatus Moranbacteria bacterium]|nr:hypothetical protein [Candidatus Moranbacteria bacterium]